MREYTIPNPDYPTELIDRLKPLMTDEIIRVIAHSDYGEDAKEHEAAIRRIIQEPRIPRPMRWEPREPLELTRWWNPEEHQNYEICELDIGDAHIARAFSCACLLACVSDEIGEPFDSLPGLIGSCYSIDSSLLMDIPPLIDWYLNLYPTGSEYDVNHEELIASNIGKIVICCMLSEGVALAESTLKQIQLSHDSLVVKEAVYSDNIIGPNDHWIFENALGFCTARSEWIKLAKQWLQSPPTTWDSSLKIKIIDIGTKTLPAAWSKDINR